VRAWRRVNGGASAYRHIAHGVAAYRGAVTGRMVARGIARIGGAAQQRDGRGKNGGARRAYSRGIRRGRGAWRRQRGNRARRCNNIVAGEIDAAHWYRACAHRALPSASSRLGAASITPASARRCAAAAAAAGVVMKNRQNSVIGAWRKIAPQHHGVNGKQAISAPRQRNSTTAHALHRATRKMGEK